MGGKVSKRGGGEEGRREGENFNLSTDLIYLLFIFFFFFSKRSKKKISSVGSQRR